MMFRFDPAISSAVPVDAASASPQARRAFPGPLAPDLAARIHRYWQAANYLTIGQIYLGANPLLREPLTPAHIKPRLLGHWGTSPGLNLIYAHVNRLITQYDLDAIYLAGPGHGGPALVANTYLEGSYSEIYPEITQDAEGMRRLFRQFSTPGGIPSHVSVTTPGSIHEGGELGYVLTHAFGAAFDNPNLLVVAVVGDGEAETGPLAGSWKGVNFLNPRRDGAVLPILHLNGYKISGPTVLGRTSNDEVRAYIESQGYTVHLLETDDPAEAHQSLAAILDDCYAQITTIQREARAGGPVTRRPWPAIVLRTPKGWTGPTVVDDKPVAGTFRAHQVPLEGVKTNPAHLAQLEAWLRSYAPEQLFDANGKLLPDLAALAPHGDRRMGANPHANGGKLVVDLALPDFRDYAVPVERHAASFTENTRPLGKLARDIFTRNADAANFRLTCPDETASNRLDDVFAVENRCFVGTTISIDDHISPDGRVMEVLSEHNCEGWLEGYTLTGRHGIYVTYEAFAMVSASMTIQHAKWLEAARKLKWRAPVPSLNVLLTSTCWRNDHNGFSHQGPGLIDVMLSKRGAVSRIYLPPDANCLLSVADHCLRSRDYVNLIVVDKQNHLQYLSMDDAVEHAAKGASAWAWASTTDGQEPEVVVACAGDVPTLESLAATDWLRQHVPDLRVRFVNVLDLMTLFPHDRHPHGMEDARFVELFTADKPVVFAFHGYQRAIHEVIHGRPNVERFHVRGFNEQGTTTTPFDMVVLNGMSRYDLAGLAVSRTPRLANRAPDLLAALAQATKDAVAHTRTHLEDPPEITNWTWPA